MWVSQRDVLLGGVAGDILLGQVQQGLSAFVLGSLLLPVFLNIPLTWLDLHPFFRSTDIAYNLRIVVY